MLMYLILLAHCVAHAALPGLVVAEHDQQASAVGSAVVLAPGPDSQRWTLAPQIVSSSSRVAILLPQTGAYPPPRRVSSAVLRQLDTFSAPRVERITCDDLVKRDYLYTAPGCRTTAPEPLEGFEKADADGAYPSIGAIQDATYDVETLSTKGEPLAVLNGWLEANGFRPLGPFAAAAATDFADDWHAIIANVDRVNEAVWLPPLQMETAATRLPLHLGTAEAGVAQDVTLWQLAVADEGTLSFNTLESTIPADCVLPPNAASDWYSGWVAENLPEAPTYSWSLEYYGPLSRCVRCTSDLLYSAAVLELGSYVGPSDGWVSRVRLTTQPNLGPLSLDSAASSATEEYSVVFVAHDDAITSYIPTCEDGFVATEERCPGLAEPSGCTTSRRPPLAGIVLILCALAYRRTSVATVVLLLWVPLFTPTAHAGTRPVPRADITVSSNLWTTPRISPESQGAEGPRLATVWSIDSHIAVAGWPKGALEGTMGWSLYHGRPSPRGTRFTVSEPQLGLSIRHGRYREKLSPFGRYGAAWVYTTVDSSVWRAHHASSLRIHADGGLWMGRNGRRLATFLRLSTIPRTDAWIVRFHSDTGLEGWTFLAGYVSASLHVGAAFP